MSKKEATIIQNFNAEKRKYEYSIKGYDVTKSIEILLKKHKEEYDKERRVFESTKGYLEAQQEYEKYIADLQSQLDQANERLKGAIVPKFKVGQECYYVYTKSQLRPFNIKIGRITFDTDRKNKFLYDSDFEDDDSYFEKYYGMKECDLFTTKEEAQAKLKELKGE